MWLQNRFHRSQRRVVVVAIDDQDYWHGPFRDGQGLNRSELATLLGRLGAAHPAVIGLDVGLETAAPRNVIEQGETLQPTLTLLKAVDAVARDCSVVLTKTILNEKPPYARGHDVYDTFGFGPDADVTYGHVSAAKDIRQIPIRVPLTNGAALDSFALAVYRASSHDDLPEEYEEAHHTWPYSFFMPQEAFTPREMRRNGAKLLTGRAVLAATPHELRRWFNSQVVLVGGVWHKSPHPGSDFIDGRDTPRERLPGVLTHANYVQSLLWEAMFPMSEGARTAIEILLALGISLIFLRARGWRRLGFVVGIITLVIIITWIFSAALGLFFDLVLPVVFLGLHAIVEELLETFNLSLRAPIRHSHAIAVSTLFAIVISLAAALVIQASTTTDHHLDTEGRLQVVHRE
jgi:CHASE2 domain-containing sensor protein